MDVRRDCAGGGLVWEGERGRRGRGGEDGREDMVSVVLSSFDSQWIWFP